MQIPYLVVLRIQRHITLDSVQSLRYIYGRLPRGEQDDQSHQASGPRRNRSNPQGCSTLYTSIWEASVSPRCNRLGRTCEPA